MKKFKKDWKIRVMFSDSTFSRNQGTWVWNDFDQYKLSEPMNHQCPTVYSYSSDGNNFTDYLCEYRLCILFNYYSNNNSLFINKGD